MSKRLKEDRHSPVLLAALVGCVLLAGCAFKHNDAIAFVTNTQGGIRVGVDATQKPEVQIGYNRQEFALVPVYKSGIHDGMSANHPVVAGILRQAGKAIEFARASFDSGGQLTQAGHDALRLAADLTAVAEVESRSKGESTDQQTSRLLVQLKKQTAELVSLSAARSRADLEPRMALVQNLIEVEAQKPALFAEFEEHLKFMGEEWDPHQRKDAYSVFGSFKGRGGGEVVTGPGPTVKASGGLAQFFATGVAAQILAREGGAAAVNTTASSPPEIRARAEVVALRETMEADLETVMRFVTVSGNTDRAQLEQLLKDSGGFLRRTEPWLDEFGGKPAKVLRDRLIGEGNRHVTIMAERARRIQSGNP